MHPFATLQHLLPQHGLSRCLGAVAESRQRALKWLLIEGFKRLYGVDMADCDRHHAAEFANFNDFFTRRLRPGTRPLAAAAGALLSPADGTVSQTGAIRDGRLLQAKGRDYAAADLLGDAEFAAALGGGCFTTIYLAPRDYHRVHAPCDASLVTSLEIPGRLFSVNAITERHVPALFARNERLVLRLRADFGEFALVLVGALIVASIEAAWPDAPVSPYRRRQARQPADVAFARGAEVGAFRLGSTVIALFPPGVTPADEVVAGGRVRVGGVIAHSH